MPYDKLDALENGILKITDLEEYRAHIVHYFDTQLVEDIRRLPEDKKERMFQLYHDYADVLIEIFHEEHGVLRHIIEKHPVEVTPENFLVKEYDEWRIKYNIDGVND